jgi:tripartite-type tricarboxylate transporter receptor subunit TctC
MRGRYFAVGLLPAGMMVLGAGTACGQSYPTKLVRIVTAAAGSANDWSSRVIAQELTGSLGQPVKSIKELIALARARPRELNYAAGTIGASPHLSTELFNAMARVNIVRVGYKGTGPSVIALMGGEVHLMFAGLGSVAPHIKAGRLRALAVTSAQPSALAPDLPTVASFLPGYESASVACVFAPARTPAAIINRLHQEIVRAISKPEVKAMLFNAGVEVVGSSPEELAAMVKADMARMGKVIKDAGIHE